MDAVPGRTLVVLRHAKAARQPSQRDADRPLTGRGRRDAAAAGRWLRESGLAPDVVLCSAAVRTTQTWEHVRAALGAAGERAAASFSLRLYQACADELLQAIREAPDSARVVLAVGHNPAAAQLAADLTGQEGLPFPTAALAVIAFSGSWAGLRHRRGRLAAFWSPAAAG